MQLKTRLVYAALLPAFLPAHLMMKRGLQSSLQKARRAPRVPSMLMRDPTTMDLPSARHMDPPVELDYLEHRSSAYVSTLVLDSAREAARAITGENGAEAIGDEAFARDCLGSPSAFLITRSPENDAWVLDSNFMHTDAWWNRECFEITKFVFEIESRRYELHDLHGRVHRPGGPTWLGAKRKLIAQLSLWTPIMGHAWSHFWLPDVVAATVHESMNRETNLYRLLAPHTRFANRHNHAGLWIQRASDNEPSLRKKIVPWLSIPLRAVELRQALLRAAKAYHAEDHFTLPARLDRRIPYFAMLGAYYDAAASFIEALMPELEASEFQAWAARAEEWYPGFSKVPMQQALTMIVWHMGIAHGADHLTYVAWARRYGTSEVEPSIDSLTARKPSAYARYRFLTFVNNFADYRPPPTGLDLRLVTCDQAYGFAPRSAAEKAAKDFVAGLRRAEANLKASGNQLVPLDAFIRAICF